MSEIRDIDIERVVYAFKGGMDTAAMGKRFRMAECWIERALHIGLARRRMERRKADEQADELARAMVRICDEMGPNV